MRVLLVEDDAMIGTVIQHALRDASYAVDWVNDGPRALLAMEALSYGLVLLDIGLPKLDGMAVLKRMRAASNDVPVVMLTARDATEDRVAGLDGGADDYLVKPFAMSELLARMRAVVRRKQSTAAPLLSNGIATLDPATRVACVQGQEVRLTAREFSLLQALMLRPGAILSRGELENRIYGWNEEVESNAVEFLIHALRKKLGSAIIKNVRGVGWMVTKTG
ncbi:MAG: response regulator transcription factor [Pseudomonadota bacterium]